MAKQSKKKRTPKDINQLAAFIVKETTEQPEDAKLATSKRKPAIAKNT
jgi:hypothetical protein